MKLHMISASQCLADPYTSMFACVCASDYLVSGIRPAAANL